MTALSPLQTLPLHVARMIVNHIVGNSRLELDGVNNFSDGHGPLLLPLLSVCHNIRAVSVFQYCKIFTMWIVPTSYEGSALLSYWMTHFKGASFPTHLFAREVYFHLDFLDICRGTAMEVLTRKPFSDCTFPRAWSVVVSLLPKSTMAHPDDGWLSRQTIKSNIRAFVQRVKKVAPIVRKILISVASISPGMPQVEVRHLGSLVKQLSQLVDDVEYKIYCKPMPLELQPRSASTLQFLHIQLYKLADNSPLIQRADGGYVQYPCLHTLKLGAAATFKLTQWPVYPGTAPFPWLQHLTIEIEYCFGDDTPFRGNAGTLQYLDLNLGPKAVEIFKTYKVFTPHSHPKLDCVKLGERTASKQDLFGTDAEYIRFLHSIGPNAPVRATTGCYLNTEFVSLVPAFGEYTCIQILELPSTPLSFWDVIELVKALPLLSDLHTYFLPTATLSDNVAERQPPAYVRKTYSPVGKRFRCWRLATMPGQDFEFVAKSVLMLALACLSFDYAAVSAANHPVFMAHMRKTIRMDGLKQYAPRLQRLLFGRWKNKITSVKAAQPEMDLVSIGKCEEYHDGDDGFSRNAVHNIGNFVRCIKQMAPAIGTVVITTHGKPKDSDGEGVSYFGDLLTQLYGIAAITVFSDPHGELGHCVSIDHICNLVHLSSRVDFKTGQVLSLARRNAQTLRHLELELFSSTDTTELFQDPNSGEYVNYPRLHTFKLKMVKKSQAIRGPVLGDTVPFPCLRRLYVGANYHFGDDVLFRGNSATLEYLSLALYQETVAILSTHCVFTPTSHPHLQCVNIIPLSSGTRNDFATPIEYLEYVMSIAPGASVRQIADMRSTRNAIVPALSVLGDYACIQVLSLPYTELTLWDIISLIKSLPLLSDLATKNSNLGELPLGVSTSDLPEYVRTNYTPMGKRLRCWHISYFWSYDTVEVVTVALLLALACPNFDYVAVDDYIRREKFMTAMQEKIGEPGFSQDAPRLRRLLSNA
ncbi:hypothetical protein GGH94_003791 [Coemansia aciculifera]|uniref:Uncharacterized protein n=1 Tax=Coemansia aciculifera TaxID=417176 RepID=A0A9W8IPS1_9FUNG|nr:hypothetical protein GGH94_003791 [Coemansia aciculifera]